MRMFAVVQSIYGAEQHKNILARPGTFRPAIFETKSAAEEVEAEFKKNFISRISVIIVDVNNPDGGPSLGYKYAPDESYP